MTRALDQAAREWIAIAAKDEAAKKAQEQARQLDEIARQLKKLTDERKNNGINQ